MVAGMLKERNIKVNSIRKSCLDEWVTHYKPYATKGQTAHLKSIMSGENNKGRQ